MPLVAILRAVHENLAQRLRILLYAVFLLSVYENGIRRYTRISK